MAALVLGIIAIVASFALVGALFGVAAIVFGVIGRGKAKASGAKSGMATAGLILGIAGIVLSGLFLALYVVVAESDTSSSTSKLGSADPSTYRISDDTCQLDPDGTVTAAGTLKNTSDRFRNYHITVRFLSGNSVLETGSQDVFMRAGESEDYEVSADVGDEEKVDCEVSVQGNR